MERSNQLLLALSTLRTMGKYGKIMGNPLDMKVLIGKSVINGGFSVAVFDSVVDYQLFLEAGKNQHRPKGTQAQYPAHCLCHRSKCCEVKILYPVVQTKTADEY